MEKEWKRAGEQHFLDGLIAVVFKELSTQRHRVHPLFRMDHAILVHVKEVEEPMKALPQLDNSFLATKNGLQTASQTALQSSFSHLAPSINDL